MKNVLIIGSGLSGLSCAIRLAEAGIHTILASPYPSERAQSVMAAGGINAALGSDDTPKLHIEDTMRGGCNIADPAAVEGLCNAAADIVGWLESLGTAFNRDKENKTSLRAFGGQSRKRTAYAGASTGKQIMTALICEARKYESSGLIERRMGRYFHSALIENSVCYGALLYNDISRKVEVVYSDAVVVASGGQNALFGKTTGSTLCDGYVAAKLFCQGALLKNLEFIQYHPTTIETSQKRMLISEAARGEGGRLYYLDNERRVYFMEELYGSEGNLMPRDIVAKHIYDAPSQVYLDITFLGKKKIYERLFEVASLCSHYAGIDVTKQSIPVYPSVHFFMGGLAVDREHRTNIEKLYAIGECSAQYHGANRLGGNSLLSAIHSANMAAQAIANGSNAHTTVDFSEYISAQTDSLTAHLESESRFSAMNIRCELAKLMKDCLGITRTEQKLTGGIEQLDFYLSVADKLTYDADVSPYVSYSLKPILVLARAILSSALARKESRGAHIREDYPESDSAFCAADYIAFADGKYEITFKKEETL